MLLTTVAVAGVAAGTLGAGIKIYRENKKKQVMSLIYKVEKMRPARKGMKKQPLYYSTHRASTARLGTVLVPEPIVGMGSSHSSGTPFQYHQTNRGKEAVKRWVEENIVPQTGLSGLLFGNARDEQMKALSTLTDEERINEEEREANRCLMAAGISLAFATTGVLFYPPLVLLSVPGLVYGTLPVWRQAAKAIIEENKVSIAVIDSITLPVLVATGHFFAAGLDYTLYYVAQKVLVQTRDGSKKNLIDIFSRQPRFVSVLENGVEVDKPFSALQEGDIVVINAGQMVPVDGTISEGYGSIDQRMLTGEAQPAEKEMGEQVLASTILLAGRICVEVQKAGQETVAAEISHILHETSDYTSGFQLKGQEIADRSALPTLLLGLLAWPMVGVSGTLAILCTNIGDSIRFTGPLSVLNFIHIASREGILIKDGRALELLSEVDTIVFDKTGTLTLDTPHVGQVHTYAAFDEEQLLTYAAAAEYKQTHPIARAILQAAKERGLSVPPIEEAKYEVGYGLKVQFEGIVIWLGSKRFIEMSGIGIPSELQKVESSCNEQGYSLVYVALDGQLAGAIELHPTIRPEAKEIITALRKRNLDLYIISGDHEKPTKKLAQEVGIEHYFAETLPENKADLIEQLQQEGKAVCFVGDGINDSIALKKANVSISLQGASTIAIDTAQIILMDSSLNQLDYLLDLAQRVDNNMKKNLLSTIVPGAICIGGAFFLHFGILSAIAFYNVGLVTGVANAMSPMIKYQRQQSKAIEGT